MLREPVPRFLAACPWERRSTSSRLGRPLAKACRRSTLARALREEEGDEEKGEALVTV